MKTKSLRKLGLKKDTIVQLNKKDTGNIKGKGTALCASGIPGVPPGGTSCYLQ